MNQSDTTSTLDDARIIDEILLPAPREMKEILPILDETKLHILESRQHIRNIIRWEDSRLLVVIWPCSIHDEQSAQEYADRLVAVKDNYPDLKIVMRVYFEKPRTTVGWKWFINDPYLDETFHMEDGLKLARKILLDINDKWLPVAVEFLDPISPQYIGDLVTWGAIGARTTESQTHREMASGLSASIGFKNGTDGSIDVALNAMQSAQSPHSFLGINQAGKISLLESTGNPDTHIVLRWGIVPNYDEMSVGKVVSQLEKAWLVPRVMIDTSHANSNKDYKLQWLVVNNIANQIREGSRHILGVMIESHIHEGKQSYTPWKDDPKDLKYGVSITDGCVGWDETVRLLENLNEAAEGRRVFLQNIVPIYTEAQ